MTKYVVTKSSTANGPKRKHVLEDGHVFTACGQLTSIGTRTATANETWLKTCVACAQCAQCAQRASSKPRNVVAYETFPSVGKTFSDLDLLKRSTLDNFFRDYGVGMSATKPVVKITPDDAANLVSDGDTLFAKEATIKVAEPPKPEHEYEVFWRGDFAKEQAYGVRPREADQRRVVQAINHRAALIKAASSSEHTSSTHYIVVGHSAAGEKFERKTLGRTGPAALYETRTAMVFEITEADCYERVDFIATPRGGRYKVKAL